MSFLESLTVFGVLLAIVTLRYVIFAGAAFGYVWKLKKQAWSHRIIQGKLPEKDKIWHEVRYSLITMVIFALTGVAITFAKKAGITQLYSVISDYGWTYLALSVVAMILLHDTYFYWTHRLMHTKPLFKTMHLVHHRSQNPSPWAAFSFHPTEAIVEAGILPLIVFLFPVHPLAIFFFLLYMTGMNVLGHLSFELFPHGFVTSKWTNWHNTTTHHNMHHRYINCNYGLYFNWWDKIMKTNHARYQEIFETLTEAPLLAKKAETTLV